MSGGTARHGMADITVVGGGPVGLFAVFYAGLRGASTRVVDRLERLGGQCGNIYPEKQIFDVAGIPEIPGAGLVEALERQMEQFDPHVVLGEEVRQLRALAPGGPFSLVTDRGEYPTKRVILALGLGAFSPRRLSWVPRARELEDRGVVYFVREMERFRDRRVLVIGGGDSAVDWAMEADARAAHVTLIHRSDVFQAHEGNLARLLHSGVELLPFHELVAMEGEDHLEAVRIQDNRTGEERRLPVDLLVPAIGYLHNLDTVQGWGVAVQGNSIPVDHRMQTSVPGVFAAGDIVIHPSKMKLIATGAGEAAIAANAAADEIVPSRRCLYNVAGDRYLGKRLADVAARYGRRP
ncbi:MAG: NAD(P)/FAD-dependent oxidoreductase [Deltaproteobacteria bacterium]|nr:NAD(P)/FAD-dependent oxidoreductase [Deltaproteobacteria bacterium]